MSVTARTTMTPERPQKARAARPLRHAARPRRWFWEIDKRAADPGRGADLDRADRGRGRLAGRRRSAFRATASTVAPLYYFYRQLIWIAVGAAGDDRRLDAAQADGAAAVPCSAAALLLVAAVPGAADRHGGERRAALARRRLHPVPAVRIPQAPVHRHHRLAAVADARRTRRCRWCRCPALLTGVDRAAADAAAQFRRDDHLRRGLGAARRSVRRADEVCSTCWARAASRS